MILPDLVMKADVLLPIASVLMIYLARMVELRTKRHTIPGKILENLTLRLFLLSGTMMLVYSIAEFRLRHLTLNWVTFGAGWLCAVLSFVIRRRAIEALGRFWSLHIEIRENHQLVRSGPFRWLRHPTYFSMILELLSICLIMNAYLSLILTSLLFIPALLMRIKLEEAALVEKLGNAYQSYQAQTPAIFPYKWPIAKKGAHLWENLGAPINSTRDERS